GRREGHRTAGRERRKLGRGDAAGGRRSHEDPARSHLRLRQGVPGHGGERPG
ncbi:MAG: hypothetical protein AVDCRST_MAG13-2899, partial [uncultured Solirubrobacteraceae bacterium]